MENVAAVCFDVRRSQDLAATAACTESAREVERMQTSNARPTDRRNTEVPAANRGHPSSATPPFEALAASQHRSCRRTAGPAFRSTAAPHVDNRVSPLRLTGMTTLCDPSVLVSRDHFGGDTGRAIVD
jgi:hypothetical protein